MQSRWKLLIIISISIIVTGCSSTTNSPYLTYSKNNFSIEYPSSWIVKNNITDYNTKTIVIFYPITNNRLYDTNESFALAYVDIRGGNMPMPLTAYGVLLKDTYFAMRPSAKILSVTNSTFGRYPAIKIIYTDRVANESMKGFIVFTVEKDTKVGTDYISRVYRVDFIAKEENYDKYSKDVQYMLDSFKFLNEPTRYSKG